MASSDGVERRLEKVESELRELKARLDAQARTLGTISSQLTGQTPIPATRESRPDTPIPPPKQTEPIASQITAPPPTVNGAFEANVVGTWFARLGAVAILLGAGFAFKYAIDRGLIGPGARVVIGVLAGIAFVAWGEWAYAKQWPRLGQAVGGGGVALIYLSIWAAFELYELIPQSLTFVSLIAAVAVGAALALRHDSEPLAILATFGGFLTPFLVASGDPRPGPLYAYAFVLDLAVLAIGYWKKWRALDAVALVGTWFVFAAGLFVSKTDFALVYSSVFFVLFTASSVLPLVARKETSKAGDLAILFVNSAVYYGFGLGILQEGGYADYFGIFSFSLAAAFLVLGIGLRELLQEDRNLMLVVFGLAITFLTVSIAQQLDAPWIAIVWTTQAAALLALGFRTPLSYLRWAGAAVLGVSIFASWIVDFEAGGGYAPKSLLFSLESLTIVLQIAVLYGAAILITQSGSDPTPAAWAIFLANALTVLWLTFEAKAYFDRAAVPDRQAFMFTITAIWSIYAAALMVLGVARRWKLARLMSVMLFALVIVKVSVVDLWFLPTGYRVIAFMGLGAVLLAISLLYHRFRDFVFEDEEEEGRPAVA